MKSWIDDLPQIPFRYRDLPPDGPWMTREEAGTYLGIGQYHMNALTSVTPRGTSRTGRTGGRSGTTRP
ncbi:hypothetical protein [Kitasatospora sp. NPDC089509]|uniref:hypothetical protein n=1 Tax=Kitasatospora sp. NPDC089509 TaxID=3364079 RepID=UPI0037FF3821